MKKSQIISVLWFFLLIVGVALLLYPTFSNYLHSLNQSERIVMYIENVSDEEKRQLYESLWQEAVEHNQEVSESGVKWFLEEEEKEAYENYLKIDSSGIMAYIEIPAISCYLPIYHGTGEAVLQVGVGHYEGSSLPVGGESTHCILSGHRGLPSSKLFTDIDQLQEKDIFIIYTLNEVLTYEIDQISIVEPTDFSKLQIDSGEDYCTLVTCTPYGINTHRLLVRGHRIENES